MAIVRIQHDKEKPYVMLNRAMIQDDKLSWEARGLLAYLLSLPDNWKVSVAHLSNFYKGDKKKGSGEKAIYALLKELTDLGYVSSEATKEGGKFSGRAYTVYESQQPLKTESKPKLKEKVPNACNRRPEIRRAQNHRQTINNDRKDISKKNDTNVSHEDRSFCEQESIVSFDPSTYRFPDGSPISLRMQRSIAKYSPEDRLKLQANVFYFEEQIRKGYAIKTSYEAYLQHCIKKDYASSLNNADRNRLYAQFVKEEYKLSGLNILKTVVQFKRSEKEPFESVSFSLPPETF